MKAAVGRAGARLRHLAAEAGWSNWAYLLVAVALCVFVALRQPAGAPAAPGVGLALSAGGFGSLILLLVNAARLAAAMARARPLVSPGLGVALPILGSIVLMEIAQARIAPPG